MRADQPGKTSMDHCKGPHSKIISATPDLEALTFVRDGTVLPHYEAQLPAATGV